MNKFGSGELFLEFSVWNEFENVYIGRILSIVLHNLFCLSTANENPFRSY